MSDGSAVEPPLVSFSPPEKPLSLLQTIKVARENGLVFTQDGHTTGSVAYAHALGILGPEAL
ncbi:MAG: hypothetical protein ABMA14_25550, partial [Hyphomonadaceae bacterium]